MIILIRHGQTTTNALNLLVGRSNPDLTELGQSQARSLAPFLTNVKEVWSSPLQRARDTAALAMPHLEATINDDFIEVDYGSLDGSPLSVVTKDDWKEFESNTSFSLGGGESLASVDARVHAQLDALLEDESSLLHNPREHLAIVSHVSPINSAVGWSLGADSSLAFRTQLHNGSMTQVFVRRNVPLLVHFNMLPEPR
jgi:probable phosphoglycerate mutase